MITVESIKLIISKSILKRSKVKNKEKIKTKTSEIKINLKKKSNIYRYDIINDIRWIPTNIFFEDLIEIEQYQRKLWQYLDLVKKQKTNKVKSMIIEKKPIYRSYVKLGKYQLQVLWDMSA